MLSCPMGRTHLLEIRAAMSESTAHSRALRCRDRHMVAQDECAELFSEHVRSTVDESGNVRLERQRHKLLEVPTSLCSAQSNYGLVDAVATQAYRDGAQLRLIEPPHFHELPEPVGHHCDQAMIDFLLEQHTGLIRTGPTVSADRLIEQIVAAFDVPIAVMCRRKRRTWHIVDRLRSLGHSASQAINGIAPGDVGRIVVGMPGSLWPGEYELNHRSILVVDDARIALTPEGSLALACVDARFRLYGLLMDDLRLSRIEIDSLLSTFGFLHCSVPRHGFQRVTVFRDVVSFDGPAIRCAGTDFAVLKDGIWGHGNRNSILSRLARLISCGRLAEAHERLKLFRFETSDVPQASLRTLLLTGTLDHAMTLGRALRDWPVAIGECDALPPRAARLRLIRPGSEVPNTPGLIATATGLHAMLPTRIDAIIWAGGGPHVPQLPCWVRETHGNGQGPRYLLFLDVRDRHHPLVRRWSGVRERQLDQAGYPRWGEDPTNARIRLFLQRQERMRS